MTAVDEARAEALFASDLQPSQHPTDETVRATVADLVGRLGETGCAERLAMEFGEHPDTAPARMSWALDAVAHAFHLSPV